MTSDEAVSIVREFVQARVSRDVGPQSRLYRDLGIDGDDAVEFLEDFCKQFEVDASSFPFDDYFGPEAPFSFRELRNWISGRRRREITVAQLADAVVRRRLE